VSRDHAIGRNVNRASASGEGTYFAKRAGVDEAVNALSRRQFATFLLRGHAFRSAHFLGGLAAGSEFSQLSRLYGPIVGHLIPL
jgi:hypothetical protein